MRYKDNKSLESFIETALWSTLDYFDGDDNHNPPLDEKYSIHDINTEFLQECKDLIEKFLKKAEPYFTEDEWSSSPIAHDLWLTIEGHGAGFWDGDYEQGDKLTEIAKKVAGHGWGDRLNENIQREDIEPSKNPRGKAKKSAEKKFTDEDLYQWLEDHRIMWGRKSDGTIWVRTHGYKTHGDDGHYGVEKIMMQAGYWMADEEFDRMVGQTVGLYKKRSQSKNPGENWRVRPADQKIMWGDEIEDRGNIKKPRNDTYATEGALRYVVHKKVAARLGAGSADNVEAFEDTTHIYVLSMNSGLNYAGLQTFKKTDKGPVMDGEVFLQSDTDFNSLMEIDTEAEDYDPSYDDGFSKFYELEPKEQIGLLLGYIS